MIGVNRANGEIVWDKKVAVANEFGSKEKFFTAPITAEGKVIIVNSAGDGKTRGWIAALDARTGNELWRWYVVPKPGDPGSETWKDKNNAWKTGGGGIWQTGSYDPATRLTIWGTGNPVPAYDPQARPGDNLYTNAVVALNVDTGKLAWYFQYTPNDSWDYDEVGVHMLYDTAIDKVESQDRRSLRPQRLLLLTRSHQRPVHQRRAVRERPELDQGARSRDRQAGGIQPEARRAGVQPRGARAARRSDEADVPDVARRHRAPADVLQSGEEDRLRRRHRRMLFAERPHRGVPLTRGGIDDKNTTKRTYTSDLYYGSITAFDTINHKMIAKAVTDIEIRSGTLATAGGLVFTALQDGWIVAYNDETLEELWRFNVGTPLKGAPVTYSIGPKQYLAVQAGGRHLHPVKYDKLENSSYLFVFALN